jgi:hypothetical protein
MRHLAGCFWAFLLCAACGSVASNDHPDASVPETLTVTLAGSGSVTSTPAGIDCGTTCSGSFPGGSTVVLIASPAMGASFSGWSGGGCSGMGPCIVHATAATSVTAMFGAAKYSLSVVTGGIGTGSVTSNPAGISCGATCSAMFDANTMVTLSATIGTGSSFVGWSGGGCKGISPCTVPLSAATSVSATFGLPTLFLINDSPTAPKLQRITNLTAPVITDVGPLGTAYQFGDCTWDYANNTLYAVDGRTTNSLYTINIETGAGTLVGVHGITDMFALAWYPVTDTLYGVGTTNLYTIDKTTGAATLVAPVTGSTNNNINGMIYDVKRNQMIATSYGAPFNTIDLATGILTPIAGTTSVGDNSGTTYDPGHDLIWQSNYSGGLVQKYDPNTATYVMTPGLSAQGPHTCIAYVP